MTPKQHLNKIFFAALALGLARGMSIGGVLFLGMAVYADHCPFLVMILWGFISIAGTLFIVPTHENCEHWMQYKIAPPESQDHE